MVNGSLKAQFDAQNKLDVLDLTTFGHSEYVPRSGLLQASQALSDIKQSPSTSKAQGKRGSQQRQKQQIQMSQEQNLKVAVPDSLVNDFGSTRAVCQFLEVKKAALWDDESGLNIHQIAEGMFHMQTLFAFAQAKPHLSPSEALRQICITFENPPAGSLLNPGYSQPAQPALNPHMQVHAGANPPHFLSPAHAAHLNLPINSSGTSPATLNMSPAMQNLGLHSHLAGTPQVQQMHQLQQMQQMQQMQQVPTSVGMVAQPSQQGTNTSGGTGSQVTSANASPNVQNKRRRPSTMLKAEGDDGGGPLGVNGVPLPDKVKASPKGGVKRQKGNG